MIPLVLAASFVVQQPAAPVPPRARDLGVPFDGAPGPLNAITDVTGVEVGQVTLNSGSGPLVTGRGPVRTGVTAILPRGRMHGEPVMAGWFTLNGNGEMTGTTWVEESGFLRGPVLITNTHSVGVVRDAVIEWLVRRGRDFSDYDWSLPIVAETWGNYGTRPQLRIAGVPVGREISDQLPCYATPGPLPTGEERLSRCPVPGARDPGTGGGDERGSIIVVVATDAPLLPHQLRRVAKRVTLGIARMGGIGGDSSGDIFIAFSTANPGAAATSGHPTATWIPNEEINPVFEATAQATEEAIVNALVAAKTMTGANDLRVTALPHDRLRTVLQRYNRLAK